MPSCTHYLEHAEIKITAMFDLFNEYHRNHKKGYTVYGLGGRRLKDRVYTSSQEFEDGVFSLETHQMFSVHTIRQGNLKTQHPAR